MLSAQAGMKLPDERRSIVNFGLDYDDTFTQDPGLWREFVRLARSRGHNVFVTTARNASQCEDIEANLPELEILASGGRKKDEFCQEGGVHIDVWIDDMPELIGADF